MIIFEFAGYEGVLGLPHEAAEKGRFAVRRFENGELFVTVQTRVRKAHCLIIGSIAPPDENLLSLALLSHTLKKEGCQKVTALLPYLAYDRQDKDKPGESLATGWVGSILRASGIDEVLTVDLHSERDRKLFPIPLTSIFPAELFAGVIRKHHLLDATTVAPDNGAISRCVAVNRALGRPGAEVPYFEKTRDAQGIRHTDLFGKVGARALIIDDILDTGGTLVSACEKLLQTGAREIYIIVTHGLFTGRDWKRLWSLQVQRIFCTNTIPVTDEIIAEPRITVVPVGGILKEHLGRTYDLSVAG